MPVSDFRAERLAKFFKAVLAGKEKISSTSDFKRFLEALFYEDAPSEVIERLMGSVDAKDGLRDGLRFDLSPTFINQYTIKFIGYLDNPKIDMLCDGEFLKELVLLIAEPPTVWLGLLDTFYSGKLEEANIPALAWLMIQLLSLPKSCGVDVTVDARNVMEDKRITLSSNAVLRNLGHKIEFLLEMSNLENSQPEGTHTAGGRHDNDFRDFRDIAILPTAEEFASIAKPFYRRADEILEFQGDQRVAAHLDNQFRLTREDMLYELREDVQIAQGKKKGRRSITRLGDLSLALVSCRPDGQRRFTPCTIGVTWKSGMEELQKMNGKHREKHLKNNPQILKHKAFGCLLRGDEIVAFATIDRDIEALSRERATLKLQVSGQEAIKKTFLCLKMYNNVEFLLVNTPIFAYEPILKRLQESHIAPLKEELFLFDTGNAVGTSSVVPAYVSHQLEQKAREDASVVLGTPKPVMLDASQLQSLISGIQQNVSLIQGPPGIISQPIFILLICLLAKQNTI